MTNAIENCKLFLLIMNGFHSIHTTFEDCYHSVLKFHCDFAEQLSSNGEKGFRIKYDDTQYNEADELVETYRFYQGGEEIAVVEEHQVLYNRLRPMEGD